MHAAGNNSTKLALVVVFHVLLGMALMKTMNVRLIALPAAPPPVTLLPTFTPPPMNPPSVPPPRTTAPRIVVPAEEVALPAPALPNTVATTTTVTESAPPAQAAGTALMPADPGIPQAPPAKLRPAAMADGCIKPAYPAQAARNGDTGTVTLALLVGVDGRVTATRIDRSSGFRDLDRAALTALALCTFRPALRGDVPEAGWVPISYQWTLE